MIHLGGRRQAVRDARTPGEFFVGILGHRFAAWLLCVAIGFFGLPLSPSFARAQRRHGADCRSGETVFRRGPVRAFRVSFYDALDGGTHQALLLCYRGTRQPLVLFDPGTFNHVVGERFRLRGSRLGFVIHDQGFANGSETDVGWVDVRSGRVRLGLINAGENADPGDPRLPEDHIGYAIARDGTMALIAGSSCQVVVVLPLRSRPDKFGRLLGPPRTLYRAARGGLDPSSIALTRGTVTWRGVIGAAGSVAPPMAAFGLSGTVNPTGGC